MAAARIKGVLSPVVTPFKRDLSPDVGRFIAHYKGVPEEGLFRFFSEVVQRVGDDRLRVYLYHIPPVSAVPITHKLVERLMKAYPKQIAGMKDSSDDWPHTKSMIDAFAKDGFDVFSGNEKPLIDNIKSGGVGCISATANINPGKIAETYKKYATPEGEKLQGWINEVRGVMQGYVMIPALKYCIA